MRRIVCLAVMVMLVCTASAVIAVDLLGSLSFPLWSERTTTAHAGVNQLVTFGVPDDDGVKAFYKNGFLVLPKDKYGVFADLAVMRVDPLVLGIEPKNIKEVKTEGECGVSEQGAIIFMVKDLEPDLYDVVTKVKQTQGRVDERGIVPTVLQIFGRKKHHQIEATDVVASTFGVVNADRYIEMFCKYQLGLDDASKMTDEQKYVVKSVYFDSRLKGVLEFAEAVADYSWLSQGLALRLQGFKPPMAQGQAQDDPAVAAYKAEIEQLKALVELMKSEQDARRQSAQPAPDVAVVAWSLKLPGPSQNGWDVWVDGAGYPMRVTGDVVSLSGRLGTHWIEFVPAGQAFQRWRKCVVTQVGQQIISTEVK